MEIKIKNKSNDWISKLVIGSTTRIVWLKPADWYIIPS